MADLEVGFPELDIAAAVVLLKAYAGTTGNFPSQVILLGSSQWRAAAERFLRIQLERTRRGEVVDLSKDPSAVCDTPYARHIA